MNKRNLTAQLIRRLRGESAADEQQVNLIEKGVEEWNSWRAANPTAALNLAGVNFDGMELEQLNLFGANLSGASFKGTKLRAAILSEADLSSANLDKANLFAARIGEANLNGAKLRGANLAQANLIGAKLNNADLSGANLQAAQLFTADLTNALLVKSDLSFANLAGAILKGADLTGANLVGCIMVVAELEGATLLDNPVYGSSVWDTLGKPATMMRLNVARPEASPVLVDELKLAQFIYLLIDNQQIRDVIDTITSKVILLLGRFTPQRKKVLEAIKTELRIYGYVPVLFDFDKPVSKDVTGTVETLARMARFIIADLTDPSSIPLELGTVVPFLRTTPVLSIRLRGAPTSSMFEDLRSYPWVLDTYEYQDGQSLISALPEVIAPADKRAEELRHKTQ